jgi:hypothetical protein
MSNNIKYINYYLSSLDIHCRYAFMNIAILINIKNYKLVSKMPPQVESEGRYNRTCPYLCIPLAIDLGYQYS